MIDSKSRFKSLIFDAITSLSKEKNIEDFLPALEQVIVQESPDSSIGDLGSPMFAFSKAFKMPPQKIAEEVAQKITAKIQSQGENSIGEVLNVGPYVNIKLDKTKAINAILSKIEKQGKDYGSLNNDGKSFLGGAKIMVEFSSPNTNKPLHLGHLRNDALGESVSRILKKAGAQIYKVNIINNRGIHICKSMLAYKLFHEKNGDTPKKLGMKGDHFVGQCYVEFDKYLKGEKENPKSAHPDAQEMAEELLRKWEAGDSETRKLWQMMNDWTFEGVKETYERTGVSFDKFYFESDTYLKGKDEILKGLEKGIFFKAADGSIRVDVTEAVGKGKDGEEHEKVLLRKDGTSVYITQDIGTAISRHDDWNFNELVYVVASEQIFHFKVLFYILKKLGFEWANKLYHLSYGLVNLPNGRMKSREGTVVDADDLIDSLHSDALKAIQERGREDDVGDADFVAEKVALSALHYYLLQVNPVKDMVFNPEESLSFNGNTGPYIQYMGARIASILRRAEEQKIKPLSTADASRLLNKEDEWELVKKLGDYPDTIEKSAKNKDSSVVTAYIYDMAKLFAKFYQSCPILSAETEDLKRARLALAKSTLQILKEAMELVLVPYLDRM
ncbi:arginine--tRNA ligase [Treponema pectinovorum]|uniref:arginine--tRNA ligase n=1 Tax=Treponema pectinovorum TaxID=164 RepID=UPI003D8A5406